MRSVSAQFQFILSVNYVGGHIHMFEFENKNIRHQLTLARAPPLLTILVHSIVHPVLTSTLANVLHQNTK